MTAGDFLPAQASSRAPDTLFFLLLPVFTSNNVSLLEPPTVAVHFVFFCFSLHFSNVNHWENCENPIKHVLHGGRILQLI